MLERKNINDEIVSDESLFQTRHIKASTGMTFASYIQLSTLRPVLIESVFGVVSQFQALF